MKTTPKIFNFDLLLKLFLKAVFIMGIAYYLAGCFGINKALVLPLAVLILILIVVKRYFPFVFRFLRRFCLLLLKAVLSVLKWLWQRHERRGGANVRPARMRWRS